MMISEFIKLYGASALFSGLGISSLIWISSNVIYSEHTFNSDESVCKST